jgi:hypothetical protein
MLDNPVGMMPREGDIECMGKTPERELKGGSFSSLSTTVANLALPPMARVGVQT